MNERASKIGAVMFLALAVVSGISWAQSAARPAKLVAPYMPTTWSTSNGLLTMGLDGGIATQRMTAGSMSTGSLDVSGATTTGSLRVDGGVQAGSLYVDGGANVGSLEVAGAATFRQRPTGVFLTGTLTRAASLTVGVGCSTLGSISVPGALVGDACDVASIPSAALSLGLTYDCWVTASSTVAVRGCGLVALVAAPVGDYRVMVLGP
jgi:hypothetical protein